MVSGMSTQQPVQETSHHSLEDYSTEMDGNRSSSRGGCAVKRVRYDVVGRSRA